jgi:hypothetical protein
MSDGTKYDPEMLKHLTEAEYRKIEDTIEVQHLTGSDGSLKKVAEKFLSPEAVIALNRGDYAAERFEREYFEDLTREELAELDPESDDARRLNEIGDANLMADIERADMEYEASIQEKKMNAPKPAPPKVRLEDTVVKPSRHRSKNDSNKRVGDETPQQYSDRLDLQNAQEAFLANPDHEWQEVSFSWGGYIECKCGEKPLSQEDMDHHVREIGKPKKRPMTRDTHLTDKPFKRHEGLAAYAESLRHVGEPKKTYHGKRRS